MISRADFSHALWTRVAARIADLLGLNFPPDRWADLQRGLGRAREEFGFTDAAQLGEWLLSTSLTPAQLRALASHLTIGETYFFREKKAFEFLRLEVLPRLIATRRQSDRRIRIWSAACCTGEEPYSLAILTQQVIPDLDQWKVTLLATDINERFLQRAHSGVYREWSFRDSPPGLKQQYFESRPNGDFVIRPSIRRSVVFANLNLVEDNYPSLTTDTNAMDIIFCRNVLMYFTPEQAKRVVEKLHHALVVGGWLIVSAAEGSQTLYSGFRPGNYPGIIAYQKLAPGETHLKSPASPEPQAGAQPPTYTALPELRPNAHAEIGKAPEPEATPIQIREEEISPAKLFAEGNYAEVVDGLLASSEKSVNQEAYPLLAQALANLGRLREALDWCDRWVAADKLNASSHYLRAMTLQELGDWANARQSLQRAVYLQPQMVAAHFALGNLARAEENSPEATRHFGNALRLLGSYEPDAILPEAGGLTAGRLKEMVTSLTTLEHRQ